MIPNFPQFKSLQISDRAEIEQIANKYDPYSEFDFASLWSWDVNGLYKVSMLNGNLVLILSDHFSDELFYSFLGNEDLAQTLKQIFAFPIENAGDKSIVKLVPEVSLSGIDLSKIIIEIDLDNYDYIFDLKEHSLFEGSKYGTKRKSANRFHRNYPDCAVQILDLKDDSNKQQILNLSKKWLDIKSGNDYGVNLEKESKALSRFLDAKFDHALCTSISIEWNLIAYEIFTLGNNGYAISHFSKIDSHFSGVYEYLVNQSAIILLEKGIKFLNAEEDMGLPALRYSKNSYRPVSFLRKYTLREL